MASTILTLEVFHPNDQTPEDVAAILNVSLDEDRKHWAGGEYHINKLVPMSQWDLPTTLTVVPSVFKSDEDFLMDLKEYDHCCSSDPPAVRLAVSNENDNTLAIGAEEYGVKTMEPGCGAIAIMEYYENELRLLVWADITNEDPTHVISLEGAREALREN